MTSTGRRIPTERARDASGPGRRGRNRLTALMLALLAVLLGAGWRPGIAAAQSPIGAALARLEGQVLLPRLLRRFPDLQLTGEAEHRLGPAIHGYNSLPVTLD